MREWMHVLLLAKARSLLNVDSRAALQWAEVKGQPTTSELIRQDAVPQPLATVADSYNGDFEWAAGYCDTTAELVLSSTKGGDCLRGSKGSIKLPPSAAVSLRAAMGFCSAYCERCKRCAYASVSAQWSDCSWFSSCSLDALRHDVQHFWSARIRPAPLVGSTLPSIGKAQRIAVCLAGHPRTFARRHVYTSIGEHLVGGLRAHGAKVDLFALLKTGDAPVKKQGGWNFSQVEDNSDATWAALAVLKPRAVLRLHRNHLPPHQRCLDGKRGGMGMGSLGLDRSTVQPALYATCFDIVTTRPRHLMVRSMTGSCARDLMRGGMPLTHPSARRRLVPSAPPWRMVHMAAISISTLLCRALLRTCCAISPTSTWRAMARTPHGSL
jgi:hypothetical protein